MRIWTCNIVLLFVTYLLVIPIVSHAKESKISSSEKNHILMISHNAQTGIAIEKIKESCGVNSGFIILNFLNKNPNCLFIMYTPPPKGMDIGHFSVVRAIDENNLQLIDPPYPSKILKKSDWVSNDKIIFTAIGDNFISPSKFTPLNIAAALLIFFGAVLLAYGKFSNRKLNK